VTAGQPHRLPLGPEPERWPYEAQAFLLERVAILAAEPDIRNPEVSAIAITRRWWAMGEGECPPEW
jgi:hypothetical protein